MNNEKSINALRTVLDYITIYKDAGNGVPEDVLGAVETLETWINTNEN